MLPINKKISKFNFFNSNNIQYIVIHDVGTKSTAKNNVDYFSGGNRGASAHYFVDDTSIWQSVEDKHGAWHVGDGGNRYGINNQNSIGVEMCLPSGTVTAKTEQNTIELVKHLMAKYKVPASRVVRHYDASRKNCPAQFNLDGKWTRWHQFKAKLTTPVTTPKPPATAKNDKPLTNGKIGDKVKVFDALYADSYGAGRSTAKRGSTGVIKKINSKGGKKYLVENWGWAHPNDIQLVSSTSKPTIDKKDWSKEYYTSNPGKVKLLKKDGLFGKDDVNFTGGRVGGDYPVGTVFVITGIKKRADGLPRLITQSGYLLSANKSIVQQVSASKPKLTNQQVARQIYLGQGGWGNGATRINKLKAAGYDPNVIQALVNKMF